MNRRIIGGIFVGAAITAIGLILLPLGALFYRAVAERAWQTTEIEPIIDALRLSIDTTLISLLIIVLIGTPLAYGLARFRFVGKRLLSALIELPIVLPPAVAGLGLLIALGRQSIIGGAINDYFGYTIPFSRVAVILAQVFVALPYFVRTAQLGFESIPKSVEEAALVDGADWIARLRFITLPLARNALLSGALLSWARALGEFGATILFAGNLQGVTQTLPLLVFSIFERDVNAAIWAAIILIATAILTLFLARWLLDRGHYTSEE